MSYLAETGLTILWNKIKATFGISLDVSNATITLKNGAATPTNLSQVTIPDATTSTPGVMTAAMVTKLNGIATQANKTTVDSSLSSTSTNPVQNKVVKEALDAKASSSSLAKVATSGSYTDLSNKPTIPTMPTDYWKTGESRTKNTVLAAPNGSNGAASFRALVAADIPNITVSKISNLADNYYNKSEIDTMFVGASRYVGAFGTTAELAGLFKQAAKKGMYCVATASYYGSDVIAGGPDLEPGDMLFLNADIDVSSMSDLDIAQAVLTNSDAVQSNITSMTTAEINAILV